MSVSYGSLEDLILLESPLQNSGALKKSRQKAKSKLRARKNVKMLGQSINIVHCKYDVVRDTAEIEYGMDVIESNAALNRHSFDIYWSDTVIFKISSFEKFPFFSNFKFSKFKLLSMADTNCRHTTVKASNTWNCGRKSTISQECLISTEKTTWPEILKKWKTAFPICSIFFRKPGSYHWKATSWSASWRKITFSRKEGTGLWKISMDILLPH